MNRRSTNLISGVAASFLAAGVVLSVSPAPASAQGLFEALFGGLRRAMTAPAREPVVREFADPVTSLFNAMNRPRNERVNERSVEVASGPAKAFCVRSCDGHYFPVRAQPGLSAAQACSSFCPATETRLYSGSNIDYAVTTDGSRYADLPNAYAYRKKLADGCSCNGRTAFGLANIDVTEDPTLKPGDVVATRSGLMAFNGARDKAAAFTPVQSYPNFPKGYRESLSEIKIMPPTARERSDVTAAVARTEQNRSAQLAR